MQRGQQELARDNKPGAESCFHQALTAASIDGTTNLRRCLTLKALANVCMLQGKHLEAETLLNQAFKSLPVRGDTPIVASLLFSRAELLSRTQRTADAEKLYQQVVRIRRKTFGSLSDELAESLERLGMTLREHSKYSQAIDCYQESLHIKKQSVAQNKNILEDLVAIAQLYEKQGQLSKAYQYGREAAAILEQAPGRSQRQTLEIYKLLGDISYAENRFADAELWYGKAVKIHKQAGDLATAASTLHYMAWKPYLRGDMKGSVNYAREALKLEQSLPDHPLTAHTLRMLGTIYENQNKMELALQHYRKAIAIEQQKASPYLADTTERYKRLLIRLARHTEAKN